MEEETLNQLNPEQPLDGKKIEISEESKEIVTEELEAIEEILTAIEQGDENVAYADTSSSMESIDEFLGQASEYQLFLAERKEASQDIMSGKKDEGIAKLRTWINKVKSII